MIARTSMLASIALLGTALRAPQEPPAAKPELSLVRGTRVRLAVPAGFTQHDSSCGFRGGDARASIVKCPSLQVEETSAPYAHIARNYTTEELPLGMRLLESSDTEIAGRPGMLVHATRSMFGSEMEYCIAVFGDDQHAVVISAGIPASADEALADELTACVLGARWDPSLALDPCEFLPYTFAVPEQLQLLSLAPALVMLRRRGPFTGSPMDPLLAIDPCRYPPHYDTLQEFADEGFISGCFVTEPRVESSTKLEVEGASAWEAVALGSDQFSDAEIVCYRAVFAAGSTRCQVSARIASKERETFLPLFQAFARSFKLKLPPKKM